MGEADLRGSGHLSCAGAALQLQDDLVHLPQSGRADRLAVGQAAAVGIDRQPTGGRGLAEVEQLLLGAVFAQAGLGHVVDLGPGIRVLQLRDLHVRRGNAGGREHGLGRVDARAIAGLRR